MIVGIQTCVFSCQAVIHYEKPQPFLVGLGEAMKQAAQTAKFNKVAAAHASFFKLCCPAHSAIQQQGLFSIRVTVVSVQNRLFREVERDGV